MQCVQQDNIVWDQFSFFSTSWSWRGYRYRMQKYQDKKKCQICKRHLGDCTYQSLKPVSADLPCIFQHKVYIHCTKYHQIKLQCQHYLKYSSQHSGHLQHIVQHKPLHSVLHTCVLFWWVASLPDFFAIFCIYVAFDHVKF